MQSLCLWLYFFIFALTVLYAVSDTFLHSKDYEEDFEEMDESANEDEDDEKPQRPEVGEERVELTAQRRKEIEAIQRAMDEENERVGTAQSRQSTSREEEDGPKWSRGTVLSSVLSKICLLTKARVCATVHPDVFLYV